MHDLRRRFACSSGRGNETTARAICLTKRGRRPKKFGKGIDHLRDADPGAFINTAIEWTPALGLGRPASLDLISEAEVFCDIEGIDAFLDRYFRRWMEETEAAFAELGAAEIARACMQ
jgi:hypothetical protein